MSFVCFFLSGRLIVLLDWPPIGFRSLSGVGCAPIVLSLQPDEFSNGIQGPLEIAMIATEGRGQMSGYGEVLGEDGADAVAEFIWQQAQNDWSTANS